jgi:hypothetical protein
MINASMLPELFSYDPNTGLLTRKFGRHRNKPVGCLRPDGYLRMKIGTDPYYVHVVIWALRAGEWPEGDIDHINGCKADNRLSNLRVATRQENCANSKKSSSNTSGFKGVYQGVGCWRSCIRVEGKTVHLGCFRTPELAHEAYCKAAKGYFGEFANFG